MELRDARILITGASGQVGLPVARALAAHNRLIAIGRFADGPGRQRLEALGVECIRVDLARADVSAAPADVDLVLNFAVARSAQGDFDHDLTANAEAAGALLAHCHAARAFLHCSTTAVYQPAGRTPRRETDPLGDHHRVLFPTYSISKIAAEAVVRFACRRFEVPTTIARLCVPYGDDWGWPRFHLEMLLADRPIPVHADGPSTYNPIHEEDIVASLPKLLEIATLPARIVNWAGAERVSIEQWTGYMAELTGRRVRLEPTDGALESAVVDVSRFEKLVGATRIGWTEGIRRMVRTRCPECF